MGLWDELNVAYRLQAPYYAPEAVLIRATYLKARKGANCAKTALANRMTRWAWGIYRQVQPFRQQWVKQALPWQNQTPMEAQA